MNQYFAGSTITGLFDKKKKKKKKKKKIPAPIVVGHYAQFDMGHLKVY
jgi:hypothetical protein